MRDWRLVEKLFSLDKFVRITVSLHYGMLPTETRFVRQKGNMITCFPLHGFDPTYRDRLVKPMSHPLSPSIWSLTGPNTLQQSLFLSAKAVSTLSKSSPALKIRGCFHARLCISCLGFLIANWHSQEALHFSLGLHNPWFPLCTL